MTAMTNEKLKPCPHCGGEAMLVCRKIEGDLVHFVSCADQDPCGTCKIPNTEAEAISAWNTRHGLTLTQDEAKILFDVLDRIASNWSADPRQDAYAAAKLLREKMGEKK